MMYVIAKATSPLETAKQRKKQKTPKPTEPPTIKKGTTPGARMGKPTIKPAMSPSNSGIREVLGLIKTGCPPSVWIPACAGMTVVFRDRRVNNGATAKYTSTQAMIKGKKFECLTDVAITSTARANPNRITIRNISGARSEDTNVAPSPAGRFFQTRARVKTFTFKQSTAQDTL